MPAVLGTHQYGKAGIHLLHVRRGTGADPDRHEIADVTVSTALTGDFTATHTDGDNTGLVATDSQRNLVHVLARDGVPSAEDLAVRVARRLAGYPSVRTARAHVAEQAWQRVRVGGREHPHAFTGSGGETRTATATCGEAGEHVVGGLDGLVLLKSTGSEFTGFVRDELTTLPETRDRVLATAVTARWRYAAASEPDDGWAGAADHVRRLLVETFADHHSLSLQHTLHAMAAAVLDRVPEVAEVRLSMPNRHHLLVDLAPFGRDNPGVVFHATDRPYGLIEAVVLRAGAAEAPEAWAPQPLVPGAPS